MFLAELGLEISGLNRIIKEGYALLGLISYLTAGVQEVRAWTITKGTKAPQAAGKIVITSYSIHYTKLYDGNNWSV